MSWTNKIKLVLVTTGYLKLGKLLRHLTMVNCGHSAELSIAERLVNGARLL